MTQRAVVYAGPMNMHLELPNAAEYVLPGVRWGAIEAFPSPAYWAYQVAARRLANIQIRSRLGQSLREEVVACILGGHGLPAAVGVAAFRQLKDVGAINNAPTEEELFTCLSWPLVVDGRLIKYRFARQKAKYLSAALHIFDRSTPPIESGQALRNWLVGLPGVGHKTASWISRNWLHADDVAILDIHVLRAGGLAGFLDTKLSVERNYLELEAQFLRFSDALGARASELDAVIWFEMMSSPFTVRTILRGLTDEATIGAASLRLFGRGSNVGGPNAAQARLVD